MALIKYFKNPKKIVYLPLLERIQSDDEQVKSAVMSIMEDVKKNGDKALFEYERRFDGSDLTSLFVSEEEFIEAEKSVDDELKAAMDRAYKNIYTFHEKQKTNDEFFSTHKLPNIFWSGWNPDENLENVKMKTKKNVLNEKEKTTNNE